MRITGVQGQTAASGTSEPLTAGLAAESWLGGVRLSEVSACHHDCHASTPRHAHGPSSGLQAEAQWCEATSGPHSMPSDSSPPDSGRSVSTAVTASRACTGQQTGQILRHAAPVAPRTAAGQPGSTAAQHTPHDHAASALRLTTHLVRAAPLPVLRDCKQHHHGGRLAVVGKRNGAGGGQGDEQVDVQVLKGRRGRTMQDNSGLGSDQQVDV